MPFEPPIRPASPGPNPPQNPWAVVWRGKARCARETKHLAWRLPFVLGDICLSPVLFVCYVVELVITLAAILLIWLWWCLGMVIAPLAVIIGNWEHPDDEIDRLSREMDDTMYNKEDE